MSCSRGREVKYVPATLNWHQRQSFGDQTITPVGIYFIIVHHQLRCRAPK